MIVDYRNLDFRLWRGSVGKKMEFGLPGTELDSGAILLV
jgi:hypothetical protein